MNGLTEISERIEDEKGHMRELKVRMLFEDDYRRILTDQLSQLKVEQEFFCCLIRLDVTGARRTLDNWRTVVQTMLDEHMFGTPYKVFVSTDTVVVGQDAISMHMADSMRRRYECLSRYV